MAKFVWHNGQWCEAVRVPRRSVAPAIIRDNMATVGWHPGNGLKTESKSTWRRWNRELGFTEMGTDAPTEYRPQFTPAVSKDDVGEAIAMLKQGYQPPPPEAMNAGDFADAEVRVL